jgi:hypothetical protein
MHSYLLKSPLGNRNSVLGNRKCVLGNRKCVLGNRKYNNYKKTKH